MKNVCILLIALLTCLPGCTKRPPGQPDVNQPDGVKNPEQMQPPKARVLINWDRAYRLQCREMDEVALHNELVRIGGEQLNNFNEPELYVRKAMVVEELTRFDALRGTNHWDRAATHYTEAIEKAQALVDAPDGQKMVERIAQLKYYRSRPLTMLGKYKEATQDRNDALANATVQKQIQQAEDGPQDD